MRLSEAEYEALVKKQPSKNTPQKAMYALGRLKQGTLNKTEQQYADYLESQKHLKLILWYKFEGIKFRLADNTFYTPDFAVMLPNGMIEIHEVKGFWQEDARVKIKIAADLYPFQFKAIKKQAQKHGGGWSIESF